MTEAELDREVRKIAADVGRTSTIVVYHSYDSRQSTAGLPDLIIVGEQGLIWRELKTDTGRTSAAQDLWSWLLTRNNQDFAIWRPADLHSGRVRREIEALRESV